MDIDHFAMQVSVYGALFTLIETNRGGQHGRLDLLRGQEEGYVPFFVQGGTATLVSRFEPSGESGDLSPRP